MIGISSSKTQVATTKLSTARFLEEHEKPNKEGIIEIE
jgi:hypothetical protein